MDNDPFEEPDFGTDPFGEPDHFYSDLPTPRSVRRPTHYRSSPRPRAVEFFEGVEAAFGAATAGMKFLDEMEDRRFRRRAREREQRREDINLVFDTVERGLDIWQRP